MKAIFYAALLSVVLSSPAFSQVVNNLVVFCNEGEPFTLIMNGERYNETPQTKVRVEGLTLKQYQVKIIFKNHHLKDHDTKLTFFSSGYECEFALNKRGKRKHTMDYFTEKRIEGFDPPANNNNTSTNNYQNNTTSNNNTNTDNSTNSTPTMQATPINTLITGPGITPGNQNTGPFNVNTHDGSININIGNEQLNIFKSDVLKEVGDAARQAKALSLLNNSLLSASQVKEFMNLFSSEQGKLGFAKKAYGHTKDRENYDMVVNALPSSTSQNELQKYIQSFK